MPSPFIKIYERGRHTPHPTLLPLMLMRKDFLDEVLAYQRRRRINTDLGGRDAAPTTV